MQVRPIEPDDRAYIAAQVTRHFTSTWIKSLGNEYQIDALDGFVAPIDDQPVGHVTVAPLKDDQIEIPTLVSESENAGVGSALLNAAIEWARHRGATRVFLTTSNDNLHALAFYQKRGFELVAIHRGAMDRMREIEPEIPKVAPNGIPIRDEIELELLL